MAKTVKAKSAPAPAKKAVKKTVKAAPKKTKAAAPKKTAAKSPIKKVASKTKAVAASPKKTAAKKPLKKVESKAAEIAVSAKKPAIKKVANGESEVLADLVIKGILEKKGKEIVSFDLRNLKSTVSDFFIICHADSPNQVTAIADSVEETVRKANGEKPWHSEGYENAEWLLMDYSNVVVHIFRTEQREFYGLEKLWADADVTKVAESF